MYCPNSGGSAMQRLRQHHVAQRLRRREAQGQRGGALAGGHAAQARANVSTHRRWSRPPGRRARPGTPATASAPAPRRPAPAPCTPLSHCTHASRAAGPGCRSTRTAAVPAAACCGHRKIDTAGAHQGGPRALACRSKGNAQQGRGSHHQQRGPQRHAPALQHPAEVLGRQKAVRQQRMQSQDSGARATTGGARVRVRSCRRS